MKDPDRTFPSAARATSAVVLTIAGLALVGWMVDVISLRQPLPQTSELSPLSAVELGVLALAVLLLAAPARAPRTGRALAAIAAGAGVVGVVDQVLNLDLELNTSIFGADSETATTTAVAMALLGGALIGVHLKGQLRRVGKAAALCAGAIGSAAFVGYVLGVEFFYAEGGRVQMAPQTAVSVMLLAFGTLVLRPGRRIRVLTGPSLGGRFARTFLPLVVLAQVVSGVLATQGVRSDLWSFSTAVWIMALTALASLLTLAVWAALRLHREDQLRAEQEHRLTRLAEHDPLTGGYNRRAFDAELQRAVERARRHGEGLAVCVIDLDHFKEINDAHGHAIGDDALIRVHRALHERLRATDVLARIGGDEFAALLVHVDEIGAQSAAREMAGTVARVAGELAADGHRNRLAASIGVAVHEDGMTASDVLRLADDRMYRAKRGARAA